MEGRVKILKTYSKSEEIISFYSPIFMHLQTLHRRVLVTTFYNLRPACQHINEGNLKILETNYKFEKKKKSSMSLSHILCIWGLLI